MSFKSARLAAGKTATETADFLGVTRQTIWNWEKGLTYPEASRLMPMAQFLGCSVDDLLKDNPSR